MMPHTLKTALPGDNYYICSNIKNLPRGKGNIGKIQALSYLMLIPTDNIIDKEVG